MPTLIELQQLKKKNQSLVGRKFSLRQSQGVKTILGLVIKPQKEVLTYDELEDEYDSTVDNYVYVLFQMGQFVMKVKLQDFIEPEYLLL